VRAPEVRAPEVRTPDVKSQEGLLDFLLGS
jgi:hypothetical protein